MIKVFHERARSVRELMWKSHPEHICGICGNVIYKYEDMHVDHKFPISKGGEDIWDNLQLSHAWCNESKNNKTDVNCCHHVASFKSHQNFKKNDNKKNKSHLEEYRTQFLELEKKSNCYNHIFGDSYFLNFAEQFDREHESIKRKIERSGFFKYDGYSLNARGMLFCCDNELVRTKSPSWLYGDVSNRKTYETYLQKIEDHVRSFNSKKDSDRYITFSPYLSISELNKYVFNNTKTSIIFCYLESIGFEISVIPTIYVNPGIIPCDRTTYGTLILKQPCGTKSSEIIKAMNAFLRITDIVSWRGYMTKDEVLENIKAWHRGDIHFFEFMISKGYIIKKDRRGDDQIFGNDELILANSCAFSADSEW